MQEKALLDRETKVRWHCTTNEKLTTDKVTAPARGIEDDKGTNEFKHIAFSLVIIAVKFLIRNGKGMKSTGSKLLNIGFEAVCNFIRPIAQAYFNDDTSHTGSYLGDTFQPYTSSR